MIKKYPYLSLLFLGGYCNIGLAQNLDNFYKFGIMYHRALVFSREYVPAETDVRELRRPGWYFEYTWAKKVWIACLCMLACVMAKAQDSTAHKAYLGFVAGPVFSNRSDALVKNMAEGVDAKSTLNGWLAEVYYGRRFHPHLRWMAIVSGGHVNYGANLLLQPGWYKPYSFLPNAGGQPFPWNGFQRGRVMYGLSGSLCVNTNASRKYFWEGNLGLGLAGFLNRPAEIVPLLAPEDVPAPIVGSYTHDFSSQPFPVLRAGGHLNIRLKRRMTMFIGVQRYWTFQDVVTGDLNARSTLLPERVMEVLYRRAFNAWSVQAGVAARILEIGSE